MLELFWSNVTSWYMSNNMTYFPQCFVHSACLHGQSFQARSIHAGTEEEGERKREVLLLDNLDLMTACIRTPCFIGQIKRIASYCSVSLSVKLTGPGLLFFPCFLLTVHVLTFMSFCASVAINIFTSMNCCPSLNFVLSLSPVSFYCTPYRNTTANVVSPPLITTDARVIDLHR